MQHLVLLCAGTNNSSYLTKEFMASHPGLALMTATNHKNAGNDHFRAGELSEALHEYQQGVATLDGQPRQTERDILLSTLLANAAAVHCKEQNWRVALDTCVRALDFNPGNIKARMRRASARAHTDDFEGALEDAKAVLEAVRPCRIFVARLCTVLRTECHAAPPGLVHRSAQSIHAST